MMGRLRDTEYRGKLNLHDTSSLIPTLLLRFKCSLVPEGEGLCFIPPSPFGIPWRSPEYPVRGNEG